MIFSIRILIFSITILFAACKLSHESSVTGKKDNAQIGAKLFLCKEKPEYGCIDHHALPPELLQPKDAELKPRETVGVNLASSAFYPRSEWYERCSKEINRRIVGKDPALVKPWRDGEKHLVTSWASGLNLTAVTHIRFGPRGVAITPRHVLYIKHYGYHPRVGDSVRFLTMDNRLIERNVSATKYVKTDDPSDFAIDITVIRLDADLPGSIAPMKLVRPDDAAFGDLPVTSCPVLRIDQEAKALVVLAAPGTLTEREARFWRPIFGTDDVAWSKTYDSYYEDMVRGDSSSPSIAIYTDENGVSPYLLSQVTSAGPGHGTRISNQASELQKIISDFGDADEKYKIRFGPYEYAGHAKPFCSVEAARIGTTSHCNVKVTGSGDRVVGTPKLTNGSTPRWVTQDNSWLAETGCPPNDNLVLSVILRGPDGEGLPCESNNVTPAVKPACAVELTRKGRTNSCIAALRWDKDSGPVNSYTFSGQAYQWDGQSSKIFTGQKDQLTSDAITADFNGDSLNDRAKRSVQGDWMVSLGKPDGQLADAKSWARWSPSLGPWINVMTSDFNGDKRFDIIGRSTINGQWHVAIARPRAPAFRKIIAGAWNSSDKLVDVMVGDVDGDGFSDVVGRTALKGEWWLKRGLATGIESSMQKIGVWEPRVTWKNVALIDMDGDERPEIIGMASAGRWWFSHLDKENTQFKLRHQRAFQWNDAQVWPSINCPSGNATSVEFALSGPGGTGTCRATVQ